MQELLGRPKEDSTTAMIKSRFWVVGNPPGNKLLSTTAWEICEGENRSEVTLHHQASLFYRGRHLVIAGVKYPTYSSVGRMPLLLDESMKAAGPKSFGVLEFGEFRLPGSSSST
jgi:hypothetical protein